MSSNAESIIYISSQSSDVNESKNTKISSLVNEDLSEDNNLFGYIKELAINYDLSLPNKESDSGIVNMNYSIQEKSQSCFEKDNIDRNALNEVFKIISKYTH